MKSNQEEQKKESTERMATPNELYQMMTSQMNDLAQQLFTCIKRGEIERVAGMINGVDITNLVSDEATFH